ncbi:unnamed protein product [Candida parapsilosis]
MAIKLLQMLTTDKLRSVLILGKFTNALLKQGFPLKETAFGDNVDEKDWMYFYAGDWISSEAHGSMDDDTI